MLPSRIQARSSMRLSHMALFFSFFTAAIAVIHLYIFFRLGYYFQPAREQKQLMAAALCVSAAIIVSTMPALRMLSHETATIVAWTGFPLMGFILLLLVSVVTVDAVWVATKIIKPVLLNEPQNYVMFLRSLGVAALIISVALSGFSLWNGLQPAPVKNVSIALDKLPRSLDGLRIVQISDLHIGPITDGKRTQQIVDKVNSLNPDLIVITGDLVDGSVENLRQQVAPIAELKAPLGVYFVTGNHEYFSGAKEWCEYITSLGIKTLRNERVLIPADDKKDSFYLAGIDDWHKGLFGKSPNAKKALENRDADKLTILLSHQPAAVDLAAHYGVDLQISGHTHGGQIWPFIYLVYLQQPYIKGLHRHKNTTTQIYINSGTGFWGPPMRLGSSSEITQITLRSEK